MDPMPAGLDYVAELNWPDRHPACRDAWQTLNDTRARLKADAIAGRDTLTNEDRAMVAHLFLHAGWYRHRAEFLATLAAQPTAENAARWIQEATSLKTGKHRGAGMGGVWWDTYTTAKRGLFALIDGAHDKPAEGRSGVVSWPHIWQLARFGDTAPEALL